jgi:hypothetical protein
VSIYDAWWALLPTPFEGSSSVTWRFPRGVNITAQAAINGIGGSEPPYAQVGFTGYVQSGQHKVAPHVPVFFMDDVTELEINAFGFQCWVDAGACGYLWD